MFDIQLGIKEAQLMENKWWTSKKMLMIRWIWMSIGPINRRWITSSLIVLQWDGLPCTHTTYLKLFYRLIIGHDGKCVTIRLTQSFKKMIQLVNRTAERKRKKNTDKNWSDDKFQYNFQLTIRELDTPYTYATCNMDQWTIGNYSELKINLKTESTFLSIIKRERERH